MALRLKPSRSGLIHNIISLSRTAPSVAVDIPPEVINYVEDGRNPDIFNREFVEMAQRFNQLLKGRYAAYAQMRDILAKDIMTAIPELTPDVKKIVEGTGGSIEV